MHKSEYVVGTKVVVLTEKNKSSHQRQNRQHNDGKVTSWGSLLGLPVEFSNGIAVQPNTKQQSKLFSPGSLGHGEQNLYNSQQVWCVRIQVELILD